MTELRVREDARPDEVALGLRRSSDDTEPL